MEEPTNEMRASAALEALEAYAMAKGDLRAAGEDTETILGDLLCDLRHLCDEEKIDFNLMIARSQMNHQAEVEEGRTNG